MLSCGFSHYDFGYPFEKYYETQAVKIHNAIFSTIIYVKTVGYKLEVN